MDVHCAHYRPTSERLKLNLSESWHYRPQRLKLNLSESLSHLVRHRMLKLSEIKRDFQDGNEKIARYDLSNVIGLILVALDPRRHSDDSI